MAPGQGRRGAGRGLSAANGRYPAPLASRGGAEGRRCPQNSGHPRRRLESIALERDAPLTLAATLSEFECVDTAVAGHIEPIPSDDERLEMVQTAHGSLLAPACEKRLSGISTIPVQAVIALGANHPNDGIRAPVVVVTIGDPLPLIAAHQAVERVGGAPGRTWSAVRFPA